MLNDYSRPYSLLLPEGGRVACRKVTLIGALADARSANHSRVSREITPVLLLDRDTGKVYNQGRIHF